MAGVPVILKAALPSIPVVNQLPGVKKDKNADPSTLAFSREGVRVEAGHVAAYAKVCGFPVKDTVPLTYPHMLAFPLHMQAMTDPGFPYPAIGSVHVENSITGHRPIRVGETLDVAVSCSSPRPHAKGTVVDFNTEVVAGGEVVWESRSTYLRRGVSTGSTTDSPGAPAGLRFDQTPPGTTQWK